MLDDFALVRFPRGFYLGRNLDDFALRGVGTLEGFSQRVDTLKAVLRGVDHGSGGFLGCGSLPQALTAPNALRASTQKVLQL